MSANPQARISLPITVGVDGSIASRAALDWAIVRARGRGSTVSAKLVVDDEWGTISVRDLAELRRDAEKVAERELAYAWSAAGDVEITLEVLVGAPMQELAIAARASECVAVGTHKTGSFHGFVTGSRSLQLAAMAPTPVAVIPSVSPADRVGVVVGLGPPIAGADAPVRFALREAERLGEPLTLLRAVHASNPRPGMMEEVWSTYRLGAPGVDVALRTATATAGDALASASRTAVLTVSGRPTKPGSTGFQPLGRTNSDVLMNLAGPTVVVPYLAASVTAERLTSSVRSSG